MKLKTTKEIAAFMAGIEAGRMFNLYHSHSNGSGVYWQTTESETDGLWLQLHSGQVYFQCYDDSEDIWRDPRPAAIEGIICRSYTDAQAAKKHYAQWQAEKQAKGGKS